MATSVYDQTLAAFGPLNRLMAGRLDMTNQAVARELALQDFARKQAAQEAQSEKSFSRYADLMREQQAERSAESERAFARQDKKEKDAAKERKTQREQEEQAARDLTAAKLGLPPGLSREELMEEISNQNDPQAKKQAFKNNQKALIKLYGEIEQRSAITPLESRQIQEQASAMAEQENAKNRITRPGIGDLPATVGYPEGYRPKTAADFTRDLFMIAREGKRAALRPLISQAEALENKQKELSAGIQDIASLLRTQEDQATGGTASEFNPVNEHSTGPGGMETGGPATSNMTEVDKVKAGLEMMLQDRKKAQNPSTPRTGPSLPLFSNDPVGVAIREMSQQPMTPAVPLSVLGSFGIPQDGQGFQPAQLQTPAYKPYTQQPLIKRIALREYALRRGFAPAEIEAVEAGVAAGDPVSTARAKRLHDEMVTELQLQNSTK